MEFIPAKKILQKVKFDNSKWFGIDYNINLYKGCCHGCIYCDSRSDCYHIENFDTVRSKKDCISILEYDLKTKRNAGVVGVGAMSDTYNPLEREFEITRKALKLLVRYGYGVSIDTKSDLILRDIDLLKQITLNHSCIIKFTITTANDNLSKVIEPNVCVSSERFKAIRQLTDNGIFTGVLMTPVLPFITDSEENIKQIVYLAYRSGAKFIFSMFSVTLRQNQKEYFFKKLDEFFPTIKQKYIKQYSGNYICDPVESERLYKIFTDECNRYGLLHRMEDIISEYKKSNRYEQLEFFNDLN